MKFLKSNYKLFIGIIIGILISGGVVYASQQLLAINVSYDNSTSGLQATNAQDAIDELQEKADNWINPNDMGTPQYYAFGTYKGWCSTTDTKCNSYDDFPTTSTIPP